MGGVLIGFTIDLPFVAGGDLTEPALQNGLLLWGVIALVVIALPLVRRKEPVVRTRHPTPSRAASRIAP